MFERKGILASLMLTSLVALSALSMTSCATASPSSSGASVPAGSRIEAAFNGWTPEQVRGRLVRWCADAGGQLIAASEYLVQCQKTEGVVATVLLGSAGNAPTSTMVYTLIPQDGGVRVQARQYLETRNGYGGGMRSEYTDSMHLTRMQAILNALSSEQPPN